MQQKIQQESSPVSTANTVSTFAQALDNAQQALDSLKGEAHAGEALAALQAHLAGLRALAACMEAVEQAGLRLMGARSAAEMAGVFLDAVQAIVHADCVAVCLLDHGEDHRALSFARGCALPEGDWALEPGHLPGALLREPGPLRLPAGQDALALPAGLPQHGAFLGLALRERDQVCGWMFCVRAAGSPDFTEPDAHACAALSARLAAAYDNLNLYEAVQRHAARLEQEARALAAAHTQVDFLSRHDPLTLLPNRAALTEHIARAVAGARDGERQIALLLFNLDRLARINDSLGHEAGDAMLRAVAQRASALAGPRDTLAHLGGDEFVLLLGDCLDADCIVEVARKLIDELSQPIRVGGHELIVTASIGISIYPRDGSHPSELLKAADVALSHMKEAGRNGYRFYKGEMNAHAQRWMTLETHLRRALGRRELVLHYQPQVSLGTGRICGMEALLRWNSPELGPVAPNDFIPLAEDTGLILPIGNWVIHEACRQSRAWQDAGLPAVRIAVNVSARQFMAGTVAAVVREALAATRLDPACLEIELTESVMMGDLEPTGSQLRELAAMGVSVSLDDFGTGYSSLGYLSSFMLDKLKIDQTFVRNITSEPRSAAIAQATVTLAHGLALGVTAEGVETTGQLEHLSRIGCNEVQGFLFSRAVPADVMGRMLSEQKILLTPRDTRE